MGTYRYFRDSEVKGLDMEMCRKLDMARHYAGVPFIINSGYRAGVDGVDHGIRQSAHMNRVAVDLRCKDSVTRYKILMGVIKAGFNRIGLGATHVHVDVDGTKPGEVAWFEEEQLDLPIVIGGSNEKKV